MLCPEVGMLGMLGMIGKLPEHGYEPGTREPARAGSKLDHEQPYAGTTTTGGRSCVTAVARARALPTVLMVQHELLQVAATVAYQLLAGNR
jgi:hypothetical protein